VIPDTVGPFRKSSHSGQENNCVEIAPTTTGGRAVRDSKSRRGPVLRFGPAPWQAFLAGAKAGLSG
jgi:hypothetical protein